MSGEDLTSPWGTLVERLRGEVEPMSRYNDNYITYRHAKALQKIYGGRFNGIFAFGWPAFCTASALAMIVLIVLTGNWWLIPASLIWFWNLFMSWRYYLRNRARLQETRDIQQELIRQRVQGKGEWMSESDCRTFVGDDVWEEVESRVSLAKQDLLAETLTNGLLSLSDREVRDMARMYQIPGYVSIARDDLLLELAELYGKHTIFINEPEFDTTSNEAGEVHS